MNLYVGGQVAGRTNPTAALQVTFALTGGIDTVPRAGDFVLVSAVTGSAAGNPPMAVTVPTGYTPLGQLNQSGVTADTSQNVSHKRMGATPDTTVTIPGTTNNAWGEAYSIQVWRGVDSLTPMDVTPVSAGGTGTGQPNPGAITPITPGAVIVICGGGAAGTGANYTAPTNYATDFLTAFGADTTDAMVGSGYWDGWTSGPEDPGTYGGGTTGTEDSWTAYTLALRPQAPFLPPVDLNPVRSLLARAPDVAVNLLLTTLAVTAIPFINSEWSRPPVRPPQVQVEQAPNLLLTTLAPVEIPFVPIDWSIPRLRPAPSPPEILSNLLSTTLKPPAVILVPRAPLYTPRPTRPPPVRWEAPNLLESTLAPTVEIPFIPWEEPTRVAQRRPAPDEVPQNLLGTTLAPTGIPFVPSDAPPVRRGDARRLDVEPNLLTSTLAPALAAAPFVPTDWPTPVRRAGPPPTEIIQNLLGTTLAPAAPAAPFIPWVETPVPLRVSRAGAPPEQNLLLTTLAPLTAPFVPQDWLVPPRRRVSPHIESPQNLLALDGSKGVPVHPRDWPTVATSPRSPRLELPPNLLGTTLAPTGIPFVPFDWAIPQTRALPSPIDQTPNLLTSTLAPALAAAPFAQRDWPTPQARVVSLPDEPPPNLLLMTLAPPPPIVVGGGDEKIHVGTKESLGVTASPTIGGWQSW